jgi:FkbM family methyltransferase
LLAQRQQRFSSVTVAPMSAREDRRGTKQARREARQRAQAAAAGGGERTSPTESVVEGQAADQLVTRIAFFESAQKLGTPYLGVQTADGRFVVSTDSLGMGRHLFGKQGRPEFRVLRRAVMAIRTLSGDDAIDGRVFVDIGANIGTSTVPALVSHGFGSAVCCEPEEENYRLLRANLALNDLEGRARTLRTAVSNRIGSSSLVTFGGNAWIAEDPQVIEAREQTRAALQLERPSVELPEISVMDVEVVTLDRLAETGIIDADQVGLLWIDAEGHDGHILKGAGALVARGVPVVLEFAPMSLKDEGVGMIREVAEENYTHFVDVRRQEAGRERFGLRPVEELSQVEDRFRESRFTDLLLLRLDSEQAGADLAQLLASSRLERRIS